MFLGSVLLTLAAPSDHVALDLWRGWPGAEKIYVEARFPDGSNGLFLVDTGAALSVLNEGAAERLGLTAIDADGRVAGLSGSVRWRKATIPTLSLGGFMAENVEVAVGVPGAPEYAGALPVDGILGNNVWSRWTLVVDYPADRLELHKPGTYRAKGKGAAVEFHRNHLLTDVVVTAEKDGQTRSAPVRIEIDTGAEDTSLWCQTGELFRELTTLGVEPVYGIGVDLDRVPDFQFLTETRRIPTTELRLGGRKLKRTTPLRWNSPDLPSEACGVTPGLIGFRTIGKFRVVIDYQEGRFILEAPQGRRTFDAMARWIERDVARYGNDQLRAEARVPVLVAEGKREEAHAILEKALAARPNDAGLVVLAARLDRSESKIEAALARLATLAPTELAEEGEWVPYLGSLAALDRRSEALQLAQDAVEAGTPDEQVLQELLVGLSDMLVLAGRPGEALAALDQAIAVDRGGSGFLFRRALIALAEGDRYGAIATLRSLMDVYPVGGQAMWLYALTATPADHPTFRADLDYAMGRLHPGSEPLDFVGAALRVVGDEAAARIALDKGYARDCKPLKAGDSRDNCDAWYFVLQGDKLDLAQQRIERAIKKSPDNSAFRDTAAVVALANGDLVAARAHAREAARLTPGDPYLMWQVTRMDQAQ